LDSPHCNKSRSFSLPVSSSTKSYTKYNNLTTAENHYTYNLDGWCFTLNPQLLYKVYHTNSLNAYVGTGLGINILATSKNSLYKEGINQPLTFNETTTGFLVKNLNFTLTARAGIVVNQTIDFYIYTSTPAKYSAGDAEDFSVKSRVLALCASYIF